MGATGLEHASKTPEKWGETEKRGTESGTLGGTIIHAGTLKVASKSNVGAASGTLSFQGGTLGTTQSFSMARSVTLGSGGGTFDVASATSLIVYSVISGSGKLSKSGS